MSPLRAPLPARPKGRRRRLPGASVFLAALTLSGLGHAAVLVAALQAPGAAPAPEDSAPQVLQITLVSAAALERPTPSPAPALLEATKPPAPPPVTSPPVLPPPPDAPPSTARHVPLPTEAPNRAPQPVQIAAALPPPPPPASAPAAKAAEAPPPAPVAAPSSKAAQEARQSWGGQIRGEIDRKKRFPAAARAARLEGKVRLALTVRGDGALLSVQLANSSGHPLLDEAALAAARAAAPFPPAPAKMGGAPNANYTFRLALAFTL